MKYAEFRRMRKRSAEGVPCASDRERSRRALAARLEAEGRAPVKARGTRPNDRRGARAKRREAPRRRRGPRGALTAQQKAFVESQRMGHPVERFRREHPVTGNRVWWYRCGSSELDAAGFARLNARRATEGA